MQYAICNMHTAHCTRGNYRRQIKTFNNNLYFFVFFHHIFFFVRSFVRSFVCCCFFCMLNSYSHLWSLSAIDVIPRMCACVIAKSKLLQVAHINAQYLLFYFIWPVKWSRAGERMKFDKKATKKTHTHKQWERETKSRAPQKQWSNVFFMWNVIFCLFFCWCCRFLIGMYRTLFLKSPLLHRSTCKNQVLDERIENLYALFCYHKSMAK